MSSLCRSDSVSEAAGNILATLDRAFDWEIEHGRLWYRQAHSLARLLAQVARSSVSQAAGVLAALSPLNRWEDNVSDAFGMAKYGALSPCRTTHPNRVKAALILQGHEAGEVLSGRKVRAFWRNIADPWSAVEVPVDRHVYRVAMGWHVAPRDAAPRSDEEYSEVERAYGVAGAQAGLTAASTASVAWLIARRESGVPSLPFARAWAPRPHPPD